MLESYEQLKLNFLRSTGILPEIVSGQAEGDFSIFYLLAGKAYCYLKENLYQLHPGDLIVMNNQEPYRIQFVADIQIDCIWLHFDPVLLTPFSRLFNLYHCFRDRPSEEQNKRTLNRSQQGKLLKLLNRLENLYHNPFYADEILKYTALVELVFYVNRIYMNFAPIDFLADLPENMTRILRYINDNLNSELTLDVLEKKFYLSKSYLCRLFQKYLGTGIHEYIKYQRISLAKELLLDGYSAADVCKKSGFNDYSNFRKIFKNITGISPSEYLKQQHGEDLRTEWEHFSHRKAGGRTSQLPDLVITDLFWKPAQPAADDLITFEAVVKNQGNAAVPIGIILGVGFKVDDFTVTWSDDYHRGLVPGESVRLAANNGLGGLAIWKAEAGIHKVTAHVDDVGRVVELNKENNLLEKTMVVGTNET